MGITDDTHFPPSTTIPINTKSGVVNMVLQGVNMDKAKISHFNKLWVEGMDRKQPDAEFKAYFGEFGTAECKLYKFPNGGGRGTGVVTYANEEDADKCIKAKPHLLCGRKVTVRRFIPHEGFPTSAKDDGLKLFFRTRGLNDVRGQKCLMDYFEKFEEYGKVTDLTMRPNGTASVEFDDIDATDILILIRYHDICGKTIEVSREEELGSGPGSGRRPGRGGWRGGAGRSPGWSLAFAPTGLDF